MAKKKKFIVLARNKKTSERGLELDGQHLNFERGKGAALWVADEAKAKALQQKYPRDVAVTLDQQYTWHSNNDQGNGTRMDNIHNYTFQGVDMRGIRTTRDNGYVWVQQDGKQVRMKREDAIREGYVIVLEKQRRTNATRKTA